MKPYGESLVITIKESATFNLFQVCKIDVTSIIRNCMQSRPWFSLAPMNGDALSQETYLKSANTNCYSIGTVPQRALKLNEVKTEG